MFFFGSHRATVRRYIRRAVVVGNARRTAAQGRRMARRLCRRGLKIDQSYSCGARTAITNAASIRTSSRPTIQYILTRRSGH